MIVTTSSGSTDMQTAVDELGVAAQRRDNDFVRSLIVALLLLLVATRVSALLRRDGARQRRG